MPVSIICKRPQMWSRATRYRWLAVLACLLPGVNATSGELFATYPLEDELPVRPTIVTGAFLDAAGPQLAVVYRDGAGTPGARFYRLEGQGWSLALEVSLAPGIRFVDVISVGGRDRLIFYREGRIHWFDPRSNSEPVLLNIPIPYQDMPGGFAYAGAELLDPSHDSDIHRVDITRDLNGDGRDDLALPDFDGFWIALQQDQGQFGEAARIGPPEPNLEKYGLNDQRDYRQAGLNALTLPWYLQRIHRMDENHDGRVDLVFWNQDRFDVYHQDQDGNFSATAESFSSEVDFDLDGAHAIMFAFGGEGTFALLTGFRGKNNIKVLRELRDLNGDGIADLLLQTLTGRSLLRQRSTYSIHPGVLSENGVRFAAQPAALIKPRGKAGAMMASGYGSDQLVDLDGDGQLDFMFRSVAIGPLGMLRATIGNSVPVNVDFYRGNNGSFPDKPTLRRKIRRFAPFAGIGNVHFPAIMLGDVTGDGSQDLLVAQDPKTLRVWTGDRGADLFSGDSKNISVKLPPDERNAWLEDINADGRQDLLVLQKPSERNAEQAYTLTTLIAQ